MAIRIDGYLMDLALSEEFVFPGDSTTNPVESGADTSDHISDLPEEITLECIVSDSPIGEVASDPSRADAPAVNSDLLSNTPLPSADALAKLRAIKARRRPVAIETSLGVFESMAILELTVYRDASKAGGLFFSVRARKVNLVTNLRVKVRVKTPMAGAGGKAKSKAVVGQLMTVDDRVVWRHGNPPGAPFRGGLSEFVEVSYHKPAGQTRDEAIATGRAAIESEAVTYFREGSPTPIVGAERAALIQDLLRDANERRIATNKETAQLPEDIQVRQAQNLPPDISLERFQRTPEQTFPVTEGDKDFVSRFNRPTGAPTIPDPPFVGVF